MAKIIKILSNNKIDVDRVDNPEGLPYIDLITRSENGKIVGWCSLKKENVLELIETLSEMYNTL